MEGDKPDVNAFQQELRTVYGVYNLEQLEHLSQGASAEDRTKITAAWRAMEAELRVVVMPLIQKAGELMGDNGQEAEQAEADDGDDDDGKKDGKKAAPKAKRETEKKEKYADLEKAAKLKFDRAIIGANNLLFNAKFDEADEHRLEAARELGTLAIEAKKLRGEEKKRATKVIDGMQERLDLLSGEIEKAKKNVPAPDANIIKAKDESLHPDYEIAQWKMPYYQKAIELKLLGVDHAVKFGELSGDKQNALNNYIQLMAEGGDSIFYPLYGGNSESKQKDLEKALTLLANGNTTGIDRFCTKVLNESWKMGNFNQGNLVLDSIKTLGPDAANAVSRAFAGFRMKRKPS